MHVSISKALDTRTLAKVCKTTICLLFANRREMSSDVTFAVCVCHTQVLCTHTWDLVVRSYHIPALTHTRSVWDYTMHKDLKAVIDRLLGQWYLSIFRGVTSCMENSAQWCVLTFVCFVTL